MKANEINLNRFLSQADTQFVIPVYQRNYDWSESQCKQLIDDILKAGSDRKITAHFIGSIVYIHDDVYSASGTRELTVIDGQQRLTTITLVYVILYQLAGRLADSSLENRINETYLINKFSEEDEKLKLRPTENNDKALKLILNNGNHEEYKEFSRVLDNFNYLKTRITQENYKVVLEGINKIMFVEISLEQTKDDPQRIFESLNSTGLKLSQADLIRNYILMGLTHKVQKKIYRDFWEPIEKLAKDKSSNSSKVSEFIRDYLTYVNKDIPKKDDVYRTFKEKYPDVRDESFKENLASIKKMAAHYGKIINPDDEADKDIRLELFYINRMDINVVYPFLLKVFDDFSMGIIAKEMFIGILRLIQSYTWRRFIVGLPTNALNKIFMRLYEDIDQNDYLTSLQRTLCRKKGTQRFPVDQEVANALREKDMYNIKPKNRSYFLQKLEWHNNNEPVAVENDNITVEHIFPQKPDPAWKTDLGDEEFDFIQNNYLNTIANLTLSGNNGKLGNKRFLAKRDMNIDGGEQGYRFSHLWLNRDLAKIDKWDKEEIERRFSRICARFWEIWPLTELEAEEQTDFDEVNIFDADDPTGKKLEYALFFDRKLEITEISKLYIEVLKTLFDLQPETFFNTDLGEKITLTKEASVCRSASPLNDTYFIEANIDSRGKFERLKYALSIFDCEDDLSIKFKI